MLCIKFWKGIGENGLNGVVAIGKFLAIKNLVWRPFNPKNEDGIAQAFADESSTFTEHPKAQTQVDCLAQLRADFERLEILDDYLTGCVERPHRYRYGNK